MTKIDIISGFLGAGKTTLIKKLIAEAYAGEQLVLIENEFGEIGIDGGFLQDAGIRINEMNSGCICCSLVGDFSEALKKVLSEYHPDRILIEPSGVGKLSDVIRAVESVNAEDAVLNAFATVVDAAKCKMYGKNFGEFFFDQIENASAVILSHQGKMSEDKLEAVLAMIKEHNPTAAVVTTPWEVLNGKDILAAMEKKDTVEAELARLKAEHHHHHEHHHEHEHDHEHEHEHHHDHDHHHHGEECHDPNCSCHHHHHADEVFTALGAETGKRFTEEEIRAALDAIAEDTGAYGLVLRAKGILPTVDGKWIHFDYVPGEADLRFGSAATTGRLCVIGSQIDKEALETLFGVSLKG